MVRGQETRKVTGTSDKSRSTKHSTSWNFYSKVTGHLFHKFLNWTPNSFHGLAVRRNSRRDASPAFHSWGSGLMSDGMCLVKMQGVWAAGSLHRGIHWGQLLSLHQENLKINLNGPHASRIFWERMSPNPATICPSGVNYRKGKRENAEHSHSRGECARMKDKEKPRLIFPGAQYNTHTFLFLTFQP